MMTNKNLMFEIKAVHKRFIRRTDLIPHIRLYITYTALMAQGCTVWEKITELSHQFMISRLFVYLLAATLEQHGRIFFGDNHCKAVVMEERVPYYFMLSLRLEGRCSKVTERSRSIEAISTIMKRFDLDPSSTGFISQILQSVGSLLPDTLTTNGNEAQLVVFTSDEIFSKTTPILVTVDPISSAILRIELADTRKVEDWKRHWKCLEDNGPARPAGGYVAIYLISDEGKSLCQAQMETLVNIVRQPDTYHAIAHQLGKWVKILENAAYKVIYEEYDFYDKLDSAKSEEVINKRIEKCEKAQEITRQKVALYESYSFLYLCIVEQLQLVDTRGNLRDRNEAKTNIELALELIESLGIEKLTKAAEKAHRIMPELLNYFDRVKLTIANLTALSLEQKVLQALCLAWQWRKGMVKSKRAKARQYCRGNEEF